MKIIITENKRERLALNWLNTKFGNLTKVVKDNETFYVDENGFPLFLYHQNEKNKFVYIDDDRIWLFFKSIFGLKFRQARDIVTIWLEETYNLRGYRPFHIPSHLIVNWQKPII